MADKQRRLILAHGEKYIEAVDKPGGGRAPEPPRTYAEARERVKAGVVEALKTFRAASSKKKLPEEAVFCMRMHPDATAKSYEPIDVFGLRAVFEIFRPIVMPNTVPVIYDESPRRRLPDEG